MKTVRTNVFETNSSSTHSLSFIPEGWVEIEHLNKIDSDSPYKALEITHTLGEDRYKICTIRTSNFYKRDSTCFLVKGDLQKAQHIISCMSSRGSLFANRLQPWQHELFQAMYKAVYDYLRSKYDIYHLDIKEEESYCDDTFVDLLIGHSWDKKKDVTHTKEDVYKIVQRVISDDSIVFTCHSDEFGPFPENIGLKEIHDELKDLLTTKD